LGSVERGGNSKPQKKGGEIGTRGLGKIQTAPRRGTYGLAGVCNKRKRGGEGLKRKAGGKDAKTYTRKITGGGGGDNGKV